VAQADHRPQLESWQGEKMRFPLIGSCGEFEIPDEWCRDASLSSFVRRGKAYPCDPGVELRPLADIGPPVRTPHTKFDHGGLHRDRLVRILRGFAAGDEIPPAMVHRLPPGAFALAVREGFHRYYASLAAGYNHLLVNIVPYFCIHEG
jgi:hypothetical protein